MNPTRKSKTMEDKRFTFWQRWLLFVSIFYTIMGLLIALTPGSRIFSLHTAAIGELFFEGELAGEADNMRRFLFGPIGGTVSGYFLLQTCIVFGPFRKRETWAWHAIFWALILWFMTDSFVSIYHGAYFNIWMINIWTFIFVGVPLLMTYRSFGKYRNDNE